MVEKTKERKEMRKGIQIMSAKKYTLPDLKAKCKKMHIEFCDEMGAYQITSPDGYRFNATDTHDCYGNHHEVKEWKIKAVQNLMEDISKGLSKCPKNCLCKE